MFKSVSPLVGNQRAGVTGLPDSIQRMPNGLVALFTDGYWGGAELVYGRANGAIRMGGLCAITPILGGAGPIIYQVAEVPNTANLGKAIVVAMTPMTDQQWGWFMVSGCVPVNCNASVAADTAFGIAAAGQGGAVTAGKQILSGRIALAASTTVVKQGTANAGSTQLQVNNPDGWFCGVYLSGTGIAAGTTVVDIDPSGTVVTLSAATSAAVNGSVTATYNNGTVFYNVAHINTPCAQGQIT